MLSCGERFECDDLSRHFGRNLSLIKNTYLAAGNMLFRSEFLQRVCAVTRRRFPVGARPTRQPLQPEATGAGMEATKCLKPSDNGRDFGDRASVQAAT